MNQTQSSTYYKRDEIAMTIHPMEIWHAEAICLWSYEAPYDSYNWPSWAQMKKDETEFGDPVLRAAQYAAVLDNNSELVGYAQFFPIAGVTRLGLGLRPDLCGHGLGSTLAQCIALEARRRQPQHEIDLEVATWNKRAIRAYKYAGFHITDTYTIESSKGLLECHCMVYGPIDG